MKNTIKIWMLILISLCSAGVLAQDKDPIEMNAQQVFEQNKNALISIWVAMDGFYSYYYTYENKDTNILSGSGFIFTEDGYVGTNTHVIEGFDSLLIKTYDSVFHHAVVIYSDAKTDVAILKILDTIETKYPFIKLGNSDSVKIGQSVFAIGSPLGYEYTISEGIIAGLRTNEKVKYYGMDYTSYEKVFDKVIQITAAISPGNSGGALFSGKGEVIGITTYSYGFYGNLNFAIGINLFTRVVNSLDFKDLESDTVYKRKREEDIFASTFRTASTYLGRIKDSWYYTKQIDTMKTYDSVMVKKDSLNKIYFWKSESSYNKCIQLRPDSFYVYSGLMDLYLSTEKYPKAEDLYKQIKEKFQNDSLLNTLSSSFASSYITRKDYKAALQFYEKMLKLDTADFYIQYQIASTYELMGDYKAAIDKYNFLMKKDTAGTEAYSKLGIIYYKHFKDKKKAKEYLSKAYLKNLNSNSYYYGAASAEMLYYLGVIALDEGKKSDAILYYIELKSVYTYEEKDSKYKALLYEAITKTED